MRNEKEIDSIFTSVRSNCTDDEVRSVELAIRWISKIPDPYASSEIEKFVQMVLKENGSPGMEINCFSPRAVYETVRIILYAFPELRTIFPLWVVNAIKSREAPGEADQRKQQNDLAVISALLSIADTSLLDWPNEHDVMKAGDRSLLLVCLPVLLQNRLLAHPHKSHGSVNSKFSNVLAWYVESAAKQVALGEPARWSGLQNLIQIGCGHMLSNAGDVVFDTGTLEGHVLSELYFKMSARISLKHQLISACMFYPNTVQTRLVPV